MLVVGCVPLFVFAGWDFRLTKRPVIALHFIKNCAVLAATWIRFFDFICRPQLPNGYSNMLIKH